MPAPILRDDVNAFHAFALGMHGDGYLPHQHQQSFQSGFEVRGGAPVKNRSMAAFMTSWLDADVGTVKYWAGFAVADLRNHKWAKVKTHPTKAFTTSVAHTTGWDSSIDAAAATVGAPDSTFSVQGTTPVDGVDRWLVVMPSESEKQTGYAAYVAEQTIIEKVSGAFSVTDTIPATRAEKNSVYYAFVVKGADPAKLKSTSAPEVVTFATRIVVG